jgi:hypothetical protein
MKKLDKKTFDEIEQIISNLKLGGNRTNNEAVNNYNLFNKRKRLKKQLVKESKLTKSNSMEILHEFEQIIDTI